MKLIVKNDELIREASAIKIVNKDNGEVLLYLRGPMSMAAAGSFIKSLENKDATVEIAMDRWEG